MQHQDHIDFNINLEKIIETKFKQTQKIDLNIIQLYMSISSKDIN